MPQRGLVRSLPAVDRSPLLPHVSRSSLDEPIWTIPGAAHLNGQNGDTFGGGFGRSYVVPLLLNDPVSVTGTRVAVSTASSHTMHVGVYAPQVGSLRQPRLSYALLVTSFDMSTTGYKTDTTRYTLPAGLVFVFYGWPSASTAVVRGWRVVPPVLRTVNTTGNIGAMASPVYGNPSYPYSSGAMPFTLNTTSGTSEDDNGREYFCPVFFEVRAADRS